MEPEGSLPCSQEPANGPYSEPGASKPQLTTVSPKSILFSHLRLGLPSGLFHAGFQIEKLM